MPEWADGSRWRRYLRFWGPDVDADIDEELQYHLDRRVQDFIARGLSPERAHDAALEAFGEPATVAAALRDHDRRLLRQARRADMFQDLIYDIRYGTRQLRNAPRFTLTVVLVLALGIGANTAIFSAIDAAFLRPLPFPHPERLVTLTGLDVPFELAQGRPQYAPTPNDVRAESSVFANVAAYASGGLNLTGGTEPLRANITYVTDGFFPTLGRAPAVGRLPGPDEYVKGGPKVIVLAHSLWQRQFGGDSSVIDRTVTLNNVSYRVTGVMPADFRFPSGVDLWIPLALPFGFDIMGAFRNFLPSQFVARLAPGVTVAQAATRADVIRHRFPSGAKDDTPVANLARPLPQTLIGDRRLALLVLMASAGLLLLIACANVTNLLLARGSLRRRELAVRVVLGATRRRVFRQLIVENLLLSFAAGAVAIVVARLSLGVLSAALPPALAGVAPPEMDLRVLGFTLLLATVTSLVFGIWPAMGASRPNLGDAMKFGAGATRRRGAGARGALVVAEVSIALMLLIGAGLMLQSLHTLLQVETGMRAEGVVTGRLTLAEAKYPQPADRAALLNAIVTRLSGTPGITAAAAVSALPMEGAGGIALMIAPEEAPDDEARSAAGAFLMATPGFFKVMGATLRGEDLPSSAAPPPLRGQTDTSERVVVVNQTLARKLWPGQYAVGRHLMMGSDRRTVIGVVADIRNKRLDTAATQQLYLPMAEQAQGYASIVVRGVVGSVGSTATMARIRDAVREVDPNQPVYSLRTMDEVINTSVAPRRTNTFLLTIFGVVALVLAGVGVYGVLSYGVTQRTREIGVRVALGAQRGDVVRLVVLQGAMLTGVGIVVGLSGAFAASRLLSSILYEVSPHDPRVFVAAPVALAGIGLLAVLLPALRATRVDPMTALREE